MYCIHVPLYIVGYTHILTDPSFVHDFESAVRREIAMTMMPNPTQITAGSLVLLYQGSLLSTSLT